MCDSLAYEFNKYDLSKIDLNFDQKDNEFNLKNTKLSFNGDDISIPNLKRKKENNNYLISGNIDNKKNILDENNVDNIVNNHFRNFKIEKDIDINYNENYLLAKKSGVKFLAYRCKINSKEIKIEKKLKIIND